MLKRAKNPLIEMLNDSAVPPCTLDDRKGGLEDRKKQRRRRFKNTGNATSDLANYPFVWYFVFDTGEYQKLQRKAHRISRWTVKNNHCLGKYLP